MLQSNDISSPPASLAIDVYIEVIISDRQHKAEASSTWPPYDPLMQRQPGEDKANESHLEICRRILIAVFSSRLKPNPSYSILRLSLIAAG